MSFESLIIHFKKLETDLSYLKEISLEDLQSELYRREVFEEYERCCEVRDEIRIRFSKSDQKIC